jgi:hypothetical protein
MKYYKNENNELFVDPIVKNHIGLIELTKEEFDAQLELNNAAVEEVKIASISRLQAKLYLLDSGYYDQVMALVEENVRLKIYWTDAVNFNKDDEILKGVQTAIGLTDEQLDTMFLEASKL